jgi:hypothetical protein
VEVPSALPPAGEVGPTWGVVLGAAAETVTRCTEARSGFWPVWAGCTAERELGYVYQNTISIGTQRLPVAAIEVRSGVGPGWWNGASHARMAETPGDTYEATANIPITYKEQVITIVMNETGKIKLSKNINARRAYHRRDREPSQRLQSEHNMRVVLNDVSRHVLLQLMAGRTDGERRSELWKACEGRGREKELKTHRSAK